ncbi:GH92 family glycosyl hydrolase [Nakamurella lactea]|uniref:GH92 family glycosyl hydrolase n=1 Tax=Nakamurella lactea TaxID=459515 RepID=UPI00041968BB|nr:GH92 family glycosyl hydrolase [Nakamurella lactea]
MHRRPSRRPSLALVAGVAAALALSLPAQAAAATPAVLVAAGSTTATAAPVTDPASDVDPLVGTANAGNTFPGAVAPFGMLSFSPGQSRYYGPTSGANAGKGTVRWASPSGYQYGTDFITGFSLTHLSGAGCNGAGGDVPIMPITQDVTGSPTLPAGGISTAYSSTFSHDQEQASPGSYRVTLDSGVTASLAATARTGSARFAFPADKPAGLLIRGSDSIAGSSDAAVTIDPAARTVSGSVTSGNFCGPYTGDGILQHSYYTLHYTIAFDAPFAAVGTWKDGTVSSGSTSARGGTGYTGGLNPDGGTANGYAPAGKGSGGYLMFAPGSTVNARVGISYVSDANATANLQAENPAGRTLEQVTAATKRDWNAELGRITVGGGTDNERSTFYTALYHALLHPNLVSDVNRQYPGFDGRAHLLPADQQAQYTTFSGWDVYRSQVQLLTLLDPRRGSDIAASLLNQADQNGGVWDRWTHVTGGTHVMVGDPSAAALAGILAFGGTDFPIRRAFDSLATAARVPTQQDYSSAGWNVAVIGQRPSLDQFLSHDFYPEGCNAWGCPNETLEMAAADYGLATIAKYLKDKKSYTEFVTRSQSWQNQFNPDATDGGGYIQSRMASGSWVSGFDPGSSSGFVEGTGAQYTWMVQHNPAGLIDAMGGNDAVNARLDSFFKDADGNWVLIGPWDGTTHANMDNEPSIGAAWLYNYAGTPWKTQETVRQTISQLWLDTKDGVPGGPDGIPGNDDLGEMSSWLVFAAMGLYPENPSSADLTMAAPLFPSITVTRSTGKRLQITAPAAALDAQYIDKLKVNGATSSKTYLSAAALRKNTTVDLTLTTTPNTARGTRPADASPSNRDGEKPYTASISSPATTAVPGGLSKEVTLDVVRLTSKAPKKVTYTVTAGDGLTPILPTSSITIGADGRASVPIVLRADKNTPLGSHTVTVHYAVGKTDLGSLTFTVLVAKPAKTLLSTSFEPGQPQPAGSVRLDSTGFGEYCCGIGGTESKAQGGDANTGTWATIYSARAVTAGNHADNVLLSGGQTGQRVAAGDVFSYAVRPQATGGPFGDYVQNASQYVAVDLLFTDGTRLSDSGALASNGATLEPEQQGGALTPDTWTTVQVSIPAQAAGKTVDKVLLAFGTGDVVATAGHSDGYLRGWIDDVSITHPLPALTVTAPADAAAVRGQEFTGTLASFTGGNGAAAGDFTASIDWGDRSAASVGTIAAVDDGSYTVTGSHTYSKLGEFTATVSVTDTDGVTESAPLTVRVTKASQRDLPTLTVSRQTALRAGEITVSGGGFTPGEQVRIAVDAAGATAVTATAGADGAVQATVPVPRSAADYDTVTAFGVISASPAVGGMTVTG